ncbi:unnamed protein product, partial [Laminaria digitata]
KKKKKKKKSAFALLSRTRDAGVVVYPIQQQYQIPNDIKHTQVSASSHHRYRISQRGATSVVIDYETEHNTCILRVINHKRNEVKTRNGTGYCCNPFCSDMVPAKIDYRYFFTDSKVGKYQVRSRY